MRKAWIIGALSFVAVGMAGGLPVVAQSFEDGVMPINAPSQVPLVVIRYNQPKVFYQRQLYNVVAKAVAIKQDVTFEVVSFVPVSDDSSRSESMAQRAQGQTAALLKDMTAMGIPAQRIRVSREAVQDARQHEIYIYVD